MGSETPRRAERPCSELPVPVFLVNTSLMPRPHPGQASVTPSEPHLASGTWNWVLLLPTQPSLDTYGPRAIAFPAITASRPGPA